MGSRYTVIDIVKVPIKYKCPFCKEEVMTRIKIEGSGDGFFRENAKSSAANLVKWKVEQIVKSDPKDLLQEMQNRHCPKCKAKNPWVSYGLLGIIVIQCALLDAILFWGFIFIVNSMLYALADEVKILGILLFLIFTVAIEVWIMKQFLAKRKAKGREFMDTVPSDCYPRMLTEQEWNSEWKPKQELERKIRKIGKIVVTILFIMIIYRFFKK